MSLWETFQDNFKGFTKKNFKSASIHHLCKLRDYLQKFGVLIQKQERYNISKALYKALLEEVPIDWMEEKLMRYKNKENFALFRISRLFDSDFGRKP